MKKYKFHLGLLGLGSRTTQFYVEQLNKECQRVNGGYSTCPFLLLNTDFNEINTFLPNNFKELKTNLTPYFKEFKRINVSSLLIPNITLHETVDLMEVETNYNSSVIHPITNAINELKKNNQDHIVLFGSKHSLQSSYITSKFEENGIKVSLPTENEIRFLDIFRQHIYENKETPNDLTRYQQLIKYYSANKGIVIACTELSLIIDEITANVYDMTRIQISRALEIIDKNF